ncbi:MAG TPA: FAD-binding oxidoreductase [Gammaproteobacteria bacterium]
MPDTFFEYERKKARLESAWRDAPGQLQLAKSTISNLFRYRPREAAPRRLALGEFNRVIVVDQDARTADVEGLTTYETVVDCTLEHGFLPLVAPELKHITVGGATVGIGIESTCFRYGFVHDGLLEADVLLPGGRIVTASPSNEHADLFRALPNSYGTLGYILRARIALHPARPYVHLHVERFGAAAAYLDAMRRAAETPDIDFVEGLVFEDGRYLLMTGRFAERTPHVDDILRRHVFYKLVQERDDVYLTTRDYIFRYDPEWFWNLPDGIAYRLFRRYAPARYRNSSFYTRYVALKESLARRIPRASEPDTEPLIQDWEVPWDRAEALLEFALREVRLDGRPWAAVPIKTPRSPTLYPIEPDTLYFNLGCYLQARRPPGRERYYYTKIMDRQCFELGGLKMLYSSSFMTREEFDARYNGAAYRELKAKYDPEGKARTLYEKVVLAPA